MILGASNKNGFNNKETIIPKEKKKKEKFRDRMVSDLVKFVNQ